MPYVKVLVADAAYHGKEPLTYSSSSALSTGAIVQVPLRDKKVLGIVVGATSKPSFKIKFILDVPPLPPLPMQLLDLHSWMADFYPAPLGAITQHFLPSNLPKKPELPPPVLGNKNLLAPPLTNDQTEALSQITEGLHLLHGETGTGKTRIYIELAKQQLQQGKSSIILIPEISLSPQIAREFQQAVGTEIVKVIHSQLSRGKRQKLWGAVLQSKKPQIVIGPRSALFSPLKKVGLIVVDEAHETAYKQDKAPYYHASTVAAKLAALHNATLILGSATPLVTDYYFAQAKNRPIIHMGQIASGVKTEKPVVTVVDRRNKQAFTRNPHLSDQLIEGAQQSLDEGGQVLLFLNRRGTARVVLCETCGWQAACPNCDLPLTYHGDSHRLVCHSCSYKATNSPSCPDCFNSTILFKSAGTKAIVEEARKIFAGAKIQRFDTDNLKAERLEAHYDSVRSGDIDILVGTQTLAKGLDLPRLSFVGVINAETSLSFPDFSASERTYQLLSQVLGRIGRGHRATQAVIQSYSPSNPLLKAAIGKNWQDFYNNELQERRTFNFPPFCFLLKLTCRRVTADSAQMVAAKLKNELLQRYPKLIIDGPAPSFHQKIKNKFQWQLVVKSRSRPQLTAIIKDLDTNWSHDIDPMDLL